MKHNPDFSMANVVCLICRSCGVSLYGMLECQLWTLAAQHGKYGLSCMQKAVEWAVLSACWCVVMHSCTGC